MYEIVEQIITDEVLRADVEIKDLYKNFTKETTSQKYLNQLQYCRYIIYHRMIDILITKGIPAIELIDILNIKNLEKWNKFNNL